MLAMASALAGRGRSARARAGSSRHRAREREPAADSRRGHHVARHRRARAGAQHHRRAGTVSHRRLAEHDAAAIPAHRFPAGDRAARAKGRRRRHGRRLHDDASHDAGADDGERERMPAPRRRGPGARIARAGKSELAQQRCRARGQPGKNRAASVPTNDGRHERPDRASVGEARLEREIRGVVRFRSNGGRVRARRIREGRHDRPDGSRPRR